MRFTFEGRPVIAEPGMSIAAALVRAGEPSGVFCAIGICHGCLVTVNGVIKRGCVTPASADDVVRGGVS